MLECENPSAQEAAVDLPLLAYQHYTAVDTATGQTLPLTENESHCLQVTVPAGYRGTVQVRYTPPLLWHGAEAVTLVTILGLLGWAVYATRRRQRPLRNTTVRKVEEETVHV